MSNAATCRSAPMRRVSHCFVDGPTRLAAGKIEPELVQHQLDGRRGGGVGIGRGIQFRNVGGGTRHTRRNIGWRFISNRREVRNHDECDRLISGRNVRVMIVIIRGRHGYLSTQNLWELKELGGIVT